DQGRPPGKLRQLAHERPRAVRHDQAMAAQLLPLQDVDMARDDDGQPLRNLAHVRERFVRRIYAASAETAYALDLCWIERKEHLRGAGINDRSLRGGHGAPDKKPGREPVL